MAKIYEYDQVMLKKRIDIHEFSGGGRHKKVEEFYHNISVETNSRSKYGWEVDSQDVQKFDTDDSRYYIMYAYIVFKRLVTDKEIDIVNI